MLEVKACMVCFSVDVKLHSLHDGKLRHEFNLVSGIQVQPGNGLPEFLCVLCYAYVRRFMKFRDKCQRAYFALQELLNNNKEIKKSHLKYFGREDFGIMPPLSYIDLDKTHYEQVKFQWTRQNRLVTTTGDMIPIAHFSTLTKQDTFIEIALKKPDIQNDIKIELEDVNFEFVDNIAKEEATVEQSTSNVVNNDTEDYIDDNNDDSDVQNDDGLPDLCKVENKVDGSKFEEEYATIFPISVKEATAAMEVYKLFTSTGKFECKICQKKYHSQERLNIHSRMHDKHVSGNYHCNLCGYYYKTDFLLQTHMTEKHMYKYVCRKCPEVSFDRISAKQHFIWTHLQKGKKKNANWYESRPTWLSGKGGKRVKGVVTLKPVKKLRKLPDDFLVYSPISQEEQYQLVYDRKKTSNYIDSLFKCELCYRGFREVATYDKHMKKHDPSYAGNIQCDMCKLHFRDTRKLYKHMNITHLFKYSCRLCSYFCVNRGQAHAHYRWHKNVTYPCSHCDQVFKKLSTRLTHIRIKHPSTFICNMCGHSFVSENGLYCHKLIAHTLEERETSEAVTAAAVVAAAAGAGAGVGVGAGAGAEGAAQEYYCAECGVQFLSEAAFATHLGSSSNHATVNISIKPSRKAGLLRRTKEGKLVVREKKRGRPSLRDSEILNNGQTTSTNCEVCGKFLVNDVQARKHYESEHPGSEYLKRYMCDVCGHTTRQYANLMVHMRTHTREKPYACPHCERRFSMPSNRDRHLVVHTGEKRYQCQHCNRRFTQSSAVKLHIQTVHLKIPYAPWDKKNRKRRKELEASATLTTAPSHCLQPPDQKLLLEAPADYLNAYITYSDE